MKTTLNSNTTTNHNTLYIGLELSKKTWVLGAVVDLGKFRKKSIPSWDLLSFLEAIKDLKEKYKLAPDAEVKLCYEAGQEGFSVYRELLELGYDVCIVDPASIEINRQAKRSKTDNIDARKLAQQLYRFCLGEKCLSTLKIPSREQEDLRETHREHERLLKRQTQYSNRIVTSLKKHGIIIEGRMVRHNDFEAKLKEYYESGKFLKHFYQSLCRDLKEMRLVQEHIAEIVAEIKFYIKNAPADDRAAQMIQALQMIHGIGLVSAWRLSVEWFSWRHFNNRQEVGGAAGLVSRPYQSGDMSKDQGISKSGNKRIRRLMVELAWGWLRYQPDHQISVWFHERFGIGKRSRRKGIVAVARKLLITFWRYTEHGVLPEGTLMSEGR